MTSVLDAGALIAIDRGDRHLAALVKHDLALGSPAITHGGVVAQVWRGGAGQALLARALKSIRVLPLDESLGRRSGALLGLSGDSDAIDAAVASLVGDNDRVYTSDPEDIARLLTFRFVDADVVRV